MGPGSLPGLALATVLPVHALDFPEAKDLWVTSFLTERHPDCQIDPS